MESIVSLQIFKQELVVCLISTCVISSTLLLKTELMLENNRIHLVIDCNPDDCFAKRPH